MPEGPSIAILCEELQAFGGKKVLDISGTASIDFARVLGKKISAVKSWGKHLLICFDKFFIRIHLMMFGTYRINAHKPTTPRLHLQTAKNEVNFYTCLVKLFEQKVDDVYDWELDLMSDQWNAARAAASIKAVPKARLCDVLLDQTIFGGSGNIIKNEALFNARLHPLNLVQHTPLKKIKELIKKTQAYTLNFYKWKKAGVLSKHWNAYEQKVCPRCHIPFHIDYLGKGKRVTYYCTNCQTLYNR